MTTKLGAFTLLRPLPPFLGRGPRGVQAHFATYRSGDLTITAWLYEPSTDPPGHPGNHPLDRPAPPGGALLVGHGGVWGIPAHYDVALRRLSAAGWTVVAPNYRGEGGSDGEAEFALGEVDDTLACLQALKTLPDVNPAGTWLLGSSHGAMVSLLLLAREDAPQNLPGAIAGYGVYDVQGWFDWLQETDHPLSEDPFLVRLFSAGAGELERRSVLTAAEAIRAPVFLIHGGSDTMVPVEQTTTLAGEFQAAGKTNFRVRVEPGEDHEFIWAPDRPSSIDAWSEMFDFMASAGSHPPGGSGGATSDE